MHGVRNSVVRYFVARHDQSTHSALYKLLNLVLQGYLKIRIQTGNILGHITNIRTVSLFYKWS